MKNCFNDFKHDRRSLKDKVREGPPKTAVVPENINAVRELIMQERHMTYPVIDFCYDTRVDSGLAYFRCLLLQDATLGSFHWQV